MADLVKQLEELKNDPSQLEGPKGNAGLKHAAIVIAIFIGLAILHLTVIDSARGKKIWRAITGGDEAPETPGGGTDTPGAIDKDVQRAADGEVDAMLRLAKKAILAKDYAEALRRYEQAGNADDVQGMFEAGRAHANVGEWEGKLPKKIDEAKTWLKKAAKKGHEESMLEMAGLTLSHPMVAKAWYEQVLSRPGESEAKKKASEGLAQLEKDHPELKD
jgi:TPR repeat protein